ncbi:MAG: penicillin-binding transpeptidase domain-containing protein [Oscillospiraceae bacterium]|nr:penicillin-binding transpeptidase domain-containing protein [Oscillospiraceae bacterium]
MKKELTAKIANIIRTAILITVMVSLSFACVIRLLQIQIVDAGMYADQMKKTYTASQTIQAARGQIVDAQGIPLNTNEIVYKIIVQRAFLPFGGENEVIAGVIKVLQKHGEEWIDSAPITMEKPYKFKNVGDERLDRFKINLGLNLDATPENCIKAFADNFKIDTEKYDEEMIRLIGGIRYEMLLRDFSYQNRYMLAEDISMSTIIELKEKSMMLQGIDIVEEPIRIYLNTTDIPHIRGRINAINEQQYSVLKDSGYNLNDVIGFFGIEETMESTLRGDNGIREITRDTYGEVISDEITKDVQAGKTIKLTIDIEFQRMIERILSDHIGWLNYTLINPRPTETTAGSIVVVDVNTGAILAMANNPSYDLADYVDLMLAEASGEPIYPNKPLLNRAAAHGYRPGSSFKTVTSAAGLLHAVVGRNDTVFCSQVYTFYEDYQPRCTGYHGATNVIRGLIVSCNCYYYDVGRRLGIERLAETAWQFGVGTNLNCDIYNYPGRMTTRDIYEDLIGSPLTPGDTIQAAIGQSETLVTPLHMATIALMLANDGVRYRPYLVDSVWNYDCTELIFQTMPEIVMDLSEGNEFNFAVIREGMAALALTRHVPINPAAAPTNPNAGRYMFDGLPDAPAYKTGTPEIIHNVLYNSTVLGYYPANNPQIAFAVVLEGGEYSSCIIRNIIDAYETGMYSPQADEFGNIIGPWNAPPRVPVSPPPE